MNKLFFVFIIFLCSINIESYSQTLKSDGDVVKLPLNAYAAVHQRQDKSGKSCGILMVHSTIENLTFKGATVGVISRTGGIYYVYLRPNSQKLEIEDINGNQMKLNLPQIESKVAYEVTIYHSTSARGYLKCRSEPSGATVRLISSKNSIPLGHTPIKGNVEISEGKYTLEIERPGFKIFRKENIKISAGKTTDIGLIKLKKSNDAH